MTEMPNFESYTYAQLDEVSRSIDEDLYPDRKKVVLDLLHERANTVEGKHYLGKEFSKYDTFLQRLLSIIVDSLIVSLFMWPLGIFQEHFSETRPLFYAIHFIAIYTALIYSIYYHTICGQTIGKMLFRVKVVSYQSERDISLIDAVRRDSVPLFFVTIFYLVSIINGLSEVAIVVSAVYIFWGLLEVVSMLTNEKHRALHDYIGKTVVIRT